jgi:Putative adhesin
MMMSQVCLFCLTALGGTAMAQAASATGKAEAKKKAETRTTQSVDFDAGGEIRLDGTIGDVSVVGWDKPQVELTVLKATKKYYGLDEQEKALKLLARFPVVMIKEDENRLLVSVAPARGLLWQLLNGVTNLELSFTLRVPKASNLRVKHKAGDIQVTGVEGNISVSNRAGDVSLALSGQEKYVIDAKSRLGEVRSAFRRKKQSPAGDVSGLAEQDEPYKVCLRVDVGEIRVQKLMR